MEGSLHCGSVLAQTHLMHYRKEKKKVKLLTVYLDRDHTPHMELQGT